MQQQPKKTDFKKHFKKKKEKKIHSKTSENVKATDLQALK